jgi:transcription initiation factor TFIIB
MDCGLVIANRLADRGPEWRAFDSEQREKRARGGAPSTYTVHDKGLSTLIDRYDRDSGGRNLPVGQKAQIYRLRRWQQRIRVSGATERNLSLALSEMTKIGDSLSLPKIALETASFVYRKALKERLIRGRSLEGVISAALYVACRQCGVTRTLEEIAQTANISRKEAGSSYRLLLKKLDFSVPLVESSDYISKYCNALMMQGRAEGAAQKIFLKARDLKLTSGRGPKSIAAAACYIASVLMGERKTQREIAEVAQVTEVTLRNRYRELLEKLTFEIAL